MFRFVNYEIHQINVRYNRNTRTENSERSSNAVLDLLETHRHSAVYVVVLWCHCIGQVRSDLTRILGETEYQQIHLGTAIYHRLCI